MIAKLRGTLDSVGDGWLVLDVAGVGYLVFCSSRTLGNLPRPGEPVSLLIETVVREDHIHLFGFEDRLEREWFRLLQTVQSVGARLALAILSTLPVPLLTQSIAAQDPAELTRAPGVGQKLANRILAELKDKAPLGAADASATPPAGAENGANDDAITALVNLGYRRAEAFGAIASAARSLGAEAPVEALITAGLKELSQ